MKFRFPIPIFRLKHINFVGVGASLYFIEVPINK